MCNLKNSKINDIWTKIKACLLIYKRFRVRCLLFQNHIYRRLIRDGVRCQNWSVQCTLTTCQKYKHLNRYDSSKYRGGEYILYIHLQHPPSENRFILRYAFILYPYLVKINILEFTLSSRR